MTEPLSIHMVLAHFAQEEAAQNALKALARAHKKEGLPLDGAALVYRDEKGHVHLKEIDDAHAREGAVKGALIGGALGLLFGPLGVLGGGAIGAYYGGIAAEVINGGVPDAALHEIAALLPNEVYAVVALTTEERAADVEALLASLGGEVITEGGQAAQLPPAPE